MELTIGIPVYNAEKYIARCLDAVLHGENWFEYEIICVDDGSTDKSLEILKNYENSHNNIKIISTNNEGAFLARSKIIDEAQGKWIGFVDADDTIDSRMYKTLLAETMKNEHIDMVVCAFKKIDSKSGKIKMIQMNQYGNQLLDFTKAPMERGLLAGVNPAYWNKIYRKEKLKNRIRLDYSPPIMEDYLFAASIFPLLDGVAFVETPLYNYYDVPASVTKNIGWSELEVAKRGLQELAVHLNKTEWFVKDIYKRDLITTMTCVHLGIAFTINWSEDEEHASLKNIWIDTATFLNKEFAGWKENIYMRIGYIIRRRTLIKLYLSNRLFRFKIWVVIVRIYCILCRIIGKDLKW